MLKLNKLKKNSVRKYVTLLSSKEYINGVLVLNHSLQQVGSKYSLVVLIGRDFYKSFNRITDILSSCEIEFKILDNIFQLPEQVIKKIYSKRWINTFDKLQVFGFTSIEKIVFLDSDMLVVRNIDHLFEEKHLSFATASEQVSGYEKWTLPNSGMMVITPEKDLPQKIFNIWPIVQSKKPDFSDQDVIHEYFREIFHRNEEWRVPALYNCFVFLIDRIIKERNYNLNFKNPDSQTIAVLHFAIKERPWMMNRREIFQFYLSRLLKGKFQEIKAYNLYFGHLAAIKPGSN